jgi:hypothetical protein
LNATQQSGGSLLVLFGVFPLETLDAARSVNQLLFAGEERMAVRTDFHVNVFLCRTSRPRMTAGANDPAFDIFRMNSFFHSLFSFYLNKSRSLLTAMTSVATGAKRAIDGKAQKYPIDSYCVKVGALGPFTRIFPFRFCQQENAGQEVMDEFFIQLLII